MNGHGNAGSSPSHDGRPAAVVDRPPGAAASIDDLRHARPYGRLTSHGAPVVTQRYYRRKP